MSGTVVQLSAGVMEMDKFSDQVRRGVDEVAAIGDQLGGIIGVVQEDTRCQFSSPA